MNTALEIKNQQDNAYIFSNRKTSKDNCQEMSQEIPPIAYVI